MQRRSWIVPIGWIDHRCDEYLYVVVYPYHISDLLTPNKDLMHKISKLGARKLLVLTGRTQTERIIQNEIRALTFI